jgi:hypothetical protein
MSIRALSLKRIWAAALMMVVPPVCRAGLVWDTQLIQMTAAPGDRTAVARFHFKNIGTEPVEIRELRPSCSCTRAGTGKKSYAPGESGEVEATFTFGSQTGLREKRIQVITNEPAAQADVLTLRVKIPEILTYAPHLLLWRTGEEPTKKSIDVEAGESQKILSLKIQSVRPQDVVASIATLESGKRYRLILRPLSTTRVATVAVVISASLEHAAPHSFTVSALVR